MVFRRGLAFTVHDTNLVPFGEIQAIFAAGAGALVFQMPDSSADITITVAANSLTVGIAMIRVKAASTATGLIGFAQ